MSLYRRRKKYWKWAYRKGCFVRFEFALYHQLFRKEYRDGYRRFTIPHGGFRHCYYRFGFVPIWAAEEEATND